MPQRGGATRHRMQNRSVVEHGKITAASWGCFQAAGGCALCRAARHQAPKPNTARGRSIAVVHKILHCASHTAKLGWSVKHPCRLMQVRRLVAVASPSITLLANTSPAVIVVPCPCHLPVAGDQPRRMDIRFSTHATNSDVLLNFGSTGQHRLHSRRKLLNIANSAHKQQCPVSLGNADPAGVHAALCSSSMHSHSELAKHAATATKGLSEANSHTTNTKHVLQEALHVLGQRCC